MRQITKDYYKKLTKDRWWLSLVIANVVIAVIMMIAIAVSIQPKETQVFTHYSAYGVAGLYKGYWYFLWNYAFLAVIVLVAHGLLSVKLQHVGRRDFALVLLWATIGILLLIGVYALAIINIAALG